MTLFKTLLSLFDVVFIVIALALIWQGGEVVKSPSLTQILVASLLVITRGIVSVIVSFATDNELGKVEAAVVDKMLESELAAGRSSTLSGTNSNSTYVYTTGAHTALMQFLSAMSVWFSESVALVAIFIAMLFLNALATVAFGLVILISLLVIRRWVNRNIERYGELFQEIQLKRMNVIESTAKVRREIKTSNSEAHFLRLHSGLLRSQVQIARNLASYVTLPRHILDFSLLVVICLTAIALGIINKNESLVPSLVLLGAGAYRIMPCANAVAVSLGVIRRALGESQPFFRVILQQDSNSTRLKNLQAFSDPPLRPSSVSEIVNFSRVTFSNHDELSLINSLDLSICEGDRVLIRGESGSGKSSLFDLIIGDIEPQEGRITVFGLPPKEAILRYPRRLGVVPQNPQLIEGDLLFNVVLAEDTTAVDQGRVISVLEATGLVEPNFPLTREILNQASGNMLSGGEIQRIALARILYQRPELVVLDEPTSALDSASRNEVISAINNLNATVILISHEVEYLSWATKIVEMQTSSEKSYGVQAKAGEIT